MQKSNWILCFIFSILAFNSFAASSIKIGVIYNLAGSQSFLDKASLNGLKLAAKDINEHGGIHGKPIELIIYNSETNPKILKQHALNIANHSDINFVVGLSDTDMVLTAAPIITQAGKLFLTSGATSPLLTKQIPKYLFIASFTDNQQATALAQYVYQDLKSHTASIIKDNDMAYSQLLTQYFQETYSREGGKLLSIDKLPSTSQQTKLLLNKLKTEIKPAVILLALNPKDAFKLIKEIRKSGYTQPIIGGDSFDSINIHQEKTLSNIYYTSHGFISKDNPNPLVQTFITNYDKTYHQFPHSNFTALGYDSLKLLASSIEKAKSINVEDVRKTLSNLVYDGLTGKFIYRHSNIPEKTVYIFQIKNGTPHLVKKRFEKS